MQTFLPEDSVCIGYHTTSSSIWNLFARVCFLKKYQTSKKILDQNSSSKRPHNANSIYTTPDPSLTRNLKVTNKDLRHPIGY